VTRTVFKTIDRDIAERIFELHKKHPKLGHDGLLKVLAADGHNVDTKELQHFVDEHKIHGEQWEYNWRNSTGSIGYMDHPNPHI
jgi:hypothetical protein